MVELDHDSYLGHRTLRVDGKMLKDSAKLRHALLDRGSSHPFRVGQHGCEVCIESNWIGLFRYELLVDGRSLSPSTPLPSQAAMMLNTIMGALIVGLALTGLVHVLWAALGW